MRTRLAISASRIHLALLVGMVAGCAGPTELKDLSLEELSTMLVDKDVARRAQSAHELGRRGPEALDAQFVLVNALNDQELRVRIEATIALGKLGPEAKAAVLPLAKVLEAKEPIYEDSVLRRQAAVALGKIGDPAAHSALENASIDPTPIVKNAAREALRKLPASK